MSGVSAEAMLIRPTSAVTAAAARGINRRWRKGSDGVKWSWLLPSLDSPAGRSSGPRLQTAVRSSLLPHYRRMVTRGGASTRSRCGCTTPAAPACSRSRDTRGGSRPGPSRPPEPRDSCSSESSEQVTQADDLAHPLDVGLRVAAVLALLAVGGRAEQPDLLVVADRPHGRAGQLGDLADPQRPLGRPRWRSCSSPASVRLIGPPPAPRPRRLHLGDQRGRRRDQSDVPSGARRATNRAEHRDGRQAPQRVCMLAMNGFSWRWRCGGRAPRRP
jgi:hypothetical protein